jgi:hypothetical protein
VATRMSPILGLSGYVLVPLRASSDFTPSRGRKHDDLSPVLAIALSTKQPSPQSNRRLEHECAFAAELDPVWAAKSLAITRHVRQPMKIGQFLRLSVVLSGAICQLYGRGLIHKDLRT